MEKNELVENKKSEIFVCPKCDGEKKIDLPVPSVMIGGREPYRPDCPLCDGKGYIVVK